MQAESFDLIVVGAGPAGSEAARRGAQLGMHTLLLERRALPRPKLCGGWVSLGAQKLLGEPIPAALVEAALTGVRLRYRGTHHAHSTASSYGALVDRGDFDAWLARRAQEAGARLRKGTARTLDVSGSRPQLIVDGAEYRADAVVVATGADGPLTGAIRPADLPERSAIGLECIVPARRVLSAELTPGEAEFDFSSVRTGFSWGIHHGERIYLGIGGLRSEKKAVLQGWEKHVKRYGLGRGTAKVRGHLIPCGGFPRSLGRGRALLAGDAAGFVDAFTGEGIALAILSGRLAAEVLAATTATGACCVKAYTSRCDEAFGTDLKWSLRIKLLAMRAPRFLGALCADSDLFAAYLKVFAGQIDYSAFVAGAGRHVFGGFAGRLTRHS